MLVGQRMKHQVVTATPTMSHREAVELMKKHGIRRLPVLDNGRLVGMVVEEDLLAVQPSPATTLSVYEIYSLLDKLPLSRIMRHPVIAVGPDCPIEDAARIMLDNKIGCLPVVRMNELVGIITETDIFRILVEVLGGGQEGVHFTVRVPNEPGKLADLSEAVAQAGGNIQSVTIVDSAHNHAKEVSVKEIGANELKLRELLEKTGNQIVDIQASKPYEAIKLG